LEQGSEDFVWKDGDLKTILYHPHHTDNSKGFSLPITDVISLLSDGKFDKYNHRDKITLSYETRAIEQTRWQEFCNFYCSQHKGWQLHGRIRHGFTHIRNNLYHSLSGDRLDQLLDQQTQTLGSTTHPEHPAYKAVGYLLYLLELGQIKQEVMERRKVFQQEEQSIFDALATLP